MPTRLPTELWNQVFRQATYVPYLLKTEWDYDPDDQLWDGWQFNQELEINTRLAIVQVCREWRDIGTEFLYEAIEIDDWDKGGSSEMEALLATLHASTHTSNQQGSPPSTPAATPGSVYGWWIKHIDLPSEILLPENFEQLISLLHQCHNLSILKMRPGGWAESDIRSRLVSILESRFSHSLRRLNLRISNPNLDQPFLPNIPLTSLDVGLATTSDISALNFGGNISLATVSSLTLDLSLMFQRHPESFHFPNLHHLGLRHVSDFSIPDMQQFVERHKSTLISLYIQSWHRCTKLPSVLLAAINLRTLTFYDLDLITLGTVVEKRSFPTITHLGVLSYDYGRYMEKIMEAAKLTDGMAMFPNLTVLRLMHLNFSVPATDEWLEFVAMCAENGVALQDWQGEPLSWEESSVET